VSLRAGLSLPYIANLEKARGNPTLDTLVRLSDALDIALPALVAVPADIADVLDPPQR
jgi:transcriptional regulator with XRE-family HTH domain